MVIKLCVPFSLIHHDQTLQYVASPEKRVLTIGRSCFFWPQTRRAPEKVVFLDIHFFWFLLLLRTPNRTYIQLSLPRCLPPSYDLKLCPGWMVLKEFIAIFMTSLSREIRVNPFAKMLAVMVVK